MFDVTVVLLDDGFSSTGLVPVEVFHSAGTLWNALRGEPGRPLFRVRTVSLDGRPVRTPYGVELKPEAALADVGHTDVVMVQTSGLEMELKLVENSPLLPWLRRQYESGALVAGVCMGSAYLAEAGLLDGRTATTHWAVCERMMARWPQVDWRPDLFVTEDKRVLCSGGLYASIDLSLYLVEKLCGREVAVQCAKALLLPMPRIHQSGYAMMPVSRPHENPRIRTAEAFLQANLQRDVSIQTLAELAGLGARTFVRHFQDATGRRPAAYLQALRIETAKSLLEAGDKPVQTISTEVGYDDVAFFRTLFKRLTGMTPAEYRSHFAPYAVRARVALEAPAVGA